MLSPAFLDFRKVGGKGDGLGHENLSSQERPSLSLIAF